MPPTDTSAETPLGAGESTTKRAEEYGAEGESGRHTLGTKGQSRRPYGTSDARSATGVDPQDPIDPESPNLPPRNHGGCPRARAFRLKQAHYVSMGRSRWALPAPVVPMLATAGRAPTGAGWSFEFKWDGVRAVTAVGGGQVHVISRNSNDVTRTYPELAALASMLPDRAAVLDGEIVALDESGRARFDLLQLRMHVQRPTTTLLEQVPVTYVLFDLLHLDGQSLVDESYQRRRELLDELDLGGRAPGVRVPEYIVEVDGQQLLEVARAHHLEGIVAKRLTSRYEPGRRSRAWVKTALLNTQEVLIGGWKPGDGRRTGMIGALLLGAYDTQGRLAYLGKVGTGFTDAMLRDLHARLEPLERPDNPFETPIPREDTRAVHWTAPTLVGEVEYRIVSQDGRLRHAAWRGLRGDKSPDQVKAPRPVR